jgi:hypothetical protein
VDYNTYVKSFSNTNNKITEKLDGLQKIAGYKLQIFSSNSNNIIWMNIWIPKNFLKVADLTDTAFTVTETLNDVVAYIRGNLPGMENAFLYDIATQIGTRGSRRLHGLYKLKDNDVGRRMNRDDIIAVMPTVSGNEEYPRIEAPYGILVPEKIDGLLAAGRCFSSEEKANEAANWVPHCVAYGEAAGTAAAEAVETGVEPRNVDVRALRSRLKKQGVYLYD